MAATVADASPDRGLIALLHPFVRHCGDERRGPWRLGPRRLLDHLVVFIADGRGRFQVGEEGWEVGPGDLVWIPPDTLHAMEGFAPGMSCPYLHADLVYRPGAGDWDFSIPGGTTDLGAFAPLMHPPTPHPALAALPGLHRGPAARRAGDLVREVCRDAVRGQPFAALRMSGLVLEAVAELLRGRACPAADDDARLPALEQAAERLRALGERARIADLAAASGLSPSRFRALFALHFGLSPRGYARRSRIRRAKELMVASPLSLGDIARRTGFADVHSFSKAFRASEGMPPSGYRRCAATAAVRVEGRQAPYPG